MANKVLEYKEKKHRKDTEKKYTLQFLPESLQYISSQKTVKYREKAIKVTYLIDIIHNLILKYSFKKMNSFNISSVILKERYGSYYNYYMDFLIENNFIELIKKHQKGKNARVYKLSDNILKSPINRYKNYDKFLLKKYTKHSSYDSEIYKGGIDYEVRSKLINDLSSVKIDYAKSIFFLDSNTHDIDIYNKNKYSVECIKDNQIFYHFDDFGRMHTNFTILKSFIRKNCLLIEDEETVEIDIKNSQPLLLTKFIEENDNLIVDKGELKLFKSLTHSGNFYQYLSEKSKQKITKQEIKKGVYKVLFGKNYANKSDNLFKRLFPTIYSFIKSYKIEMGDYKVLSHNLQRSESDLVFNNIVKKLMKINPDIKIITVHDSIICAKKYKEVVEIVFNQIMKENFVL